MRVASKDGTRGLAGARRACTASARRAILAPPGLGRIFLVSDLGRETGLALRHRASLTPNPRPLPPRDSRAGRYLPLILQTGTCAAVGYAAKATPREVNYE